MFHAGSKIGGMRKHFAFLWLCVREALPGNAAPANDWQWVVASPMWQFFGTGIGAALGGFTSRYWDWVPAMTPDTVLGTLLGGLFGFAVTWLIVFLIRCLRSPTH